jgi:hypothetical protein
MAMIFLPIYSVSTTRVYGSTSELDWREVCLLVQPALYKSCNVYVDINGSLTTEGERAFECIRNGALILKGAWFFGLDPYATLPGSEALTEMTGCGGIVNFQILKTLDLTIIIDILEK